MHMKYIFINILKLFYLLKKISISPILLTSTGSQRTGLRDIRISSFSLSLVPRCPVSPSGKDTVGSPAGTRHSEHEAVRDQPSRFGFMSWTYLRTFSLLPKGASVTKTDLPTNM